MDKYEYKVRAEEIKTLIAGGEFAEAVKIADTIDWHRVKSVMMLCTISDLYKINRRFQESKDILLMAYERHPGGRLIVYSLCELSIKMGEFVQAIEYYKEFVQIAPKDTGRYILQYKLYEAQDVSLEERIAVLEEFKKRDYREKWAYELAYLYHRVGLETKCVEECDEMILWFGEGRYVLKALELKQLHQPLSESQQETYLKMKRGIEEPEEEQEEEEDDEEDSVDELTEESGVLEESEEPEEDAEPKEEIILIDDIPTIEEETKPEEDFKVKTVDLGKYNTINLQKELAESMKEILGDDVRIRPEEDSMKPIVESIVAPLLQETGNIPQETLEKSARISEMEDLEFLELDDEEDEDGTAAPAETVEKSAKQSKKEPKAAPQEPAAPIALEEVFFEEDSKDINIKDINIQDMNINDMNINDKNIIDILQQDTKRINLGDTKEILPGTKVVYPTTLPSRFAMVDKNVSYQEEKQPEADTEAVSDEAPKIIQAQPNLMKTHKPSGFEQMLSQEYDGQISLVVPNSDKVEKQITGQMNIADIMAEWERTKRANEEKRREDVRKRVQKHTGNMFSEFDEATKSGLLEQLEKAVIEAILKESNQNTINPSEISEQQITDIVKSVGRKNEIPIQPTPQKEEKQQDNIVNFEYVKTMADSYDNAEKQEEKEAVEEMPAAEVPVEDIPEENVSENEMTAEDPSLTEGISVEEIKEIVENAEKTKTAGEEETKTSQKTVQSAKSGTHTEHKARDFSPEEKELFGRFSHNRKSKEQILHAIDVMSMDSYSGNIIVTGEEEAGTLDLAKNMVRMMQLTDRNFSGKVAKISGETLNKKDVPATLTKLTDGALIIEHATDMSSGTATDLNKALAKENRGLLVIIEGKRDEMNIFLRKNRALLDNFNARIDIDSLDDQALVAYAKQYAEEQEYSIDELGILALHTRIADMQTSDHEVTVAEVKELVDDAIYFADKKNPKHFFDILFGKRYDAEDMIILREKDFMHY